MTGLFSRETRRAIAMRPGERPVVVWAAAWFFFLLAGYSFLRPLREQMGIAGGVRNLPWLFLATLTVMMLANPLFGAVVSRLPRERFIPVIYRFFATHLLVFFALMQGLPDGAQIWVGRAFFVWLSVFNLFVVTLFWSFLADNFASESAKRLYPWIAVGGTLGSVAGSAVTWGGLAWAEAAGLESDALLPFLLLLTVLLLEVTVRCVRRLGGVLEAGAGALAAAPSPPRGRSLGGRPLDGLREVARSRYLLTICAYLLLYTVTGSILYFAQADIVEARFASRAERTGAFAFIDLAVQLATLGLQLFVTRRLIAAIGLGRTLAFLPLIAGLGFAALAAVPAFGVLVAVQVLRRSARYAVSKPAREVLFAVVSRSEKYKAKAVIDTFVYRSGDVLGAGISKLLGVLAPGLLAVAFLAVPLCGVWALLALVLGRAHALRARAGGDGPGGVQYSPPTTEAGPAPEHQSPAR